MTDKSISFANAIKQNQESKEPRKESEQKKSVANRSRKDSRKKTSIDEKREQRYSRTGAKHIGGYFPPAVSKQLKILVANEGTTSQSLVGEALNKLFESRNLPAIAESKKEL